MVDSAFWSDRSVAYVRIRAANRGDTIRLDYMRRGWRADGWVSRWDLGGGTAAARQDFVRTAGLCAAGCGLTPNDDEAWKRFLDAMLEWLQAGESYGSKEWRPADPAPLVHWSTFSTDDSWRPSAAFPSTEPAGGNAEPQAPVVPSERSAAIDDACEAASHFCLALRDEALKYEIAPAPTPAPSPVDPPPPPPGGGPLPIDVPPFGEQLSTAMRAKRVTTAELAEASKVDERGIRHYLTGTRVPTRLDVIRRLEQALEAAFLLPERRARRRRTKRSEKARKRP